MVTFSPCVTRMTSLNHLVFSCSRRIRVSIFLFYLLLVHRFTASTATFQIKDPELNEVILETERIMLLCFSDNTVNPSFNVVDDQGLAIVQNNIAMKENSFSYVLDNQLNLQTVVDSLTRSSLTCQIFEDGNKISEEGLFLDIRPKDQPACLMSTGPYVALGDTVRVVCYEGLVPTAIWRQTKDNGNSFENLLTTESTLINQFKRKYTATIVVTAEDDGSVFECEVDSQTCRTDEIIVRNGLTIDFDSPNPQTIKINEPSVVTCMASNPSASVGWQHDYGLRSDISIMSLGDSALLITILEETTVTNGFLLNFECIATLGQFEARDTFQFVVDSSISTKPPDATEQRATLKSSTEELSSKQTIPTRPATRTSLIRHFTTIKTLGDDNSGVMTLYFVVGGIAAVILIALIMFISVAICITHSNTPKKDVGQDQRRKGKQINTISHIVENCDMSLTSPSYTEVTKDPNPSRFASSTPDVIPYSDVNKRQVFIDEEEIYDETLNWRSEEF